MINRLSLNHKKSQNIHLNLNYQRLQKQNNQKNLNRTKKITKPTQLQQCLNIKQVDHKNYLSNADNKTNLQSKYNSIKPIIDLKPKEISNTFSKPKIQSMVQNQRKKSDTQQFCELYGPDILVQHKNKPLYKNRFLANHQINAQLRARMLDWMVQVMESYNFINKTYFSAVELMDRYLTETQQNVPLSKLHILGASSMYIATKMQEVYPLKLKTVFQKIVHQKISKQALVQMEMKMFSKLNHKLNSWTFFDLALLKVFNQVDIESKQKKNELEDVTKFISRCIIYDYDIYTKFDMESLAEIVANIGAKICGLRFENKISLECYQQVKILYKNFKDNFKGLNNIYKFTNESIVSLVDSYFNGSN